MDRVLGDHRAEVFEDILDGARAGPFAALQFAAAVGTPRGAVLDLLVDVLRSRPVRALVPGLGAGLALAFSLRRRLGVDRPLARGRIGIDLLGALKLPVQLGDAAVQLGDPLGCSQQNQLDEHGIHGGKLFGLLVGQLPSQRAFDQRRQVRIALKDCLHLSGDYRTLARENLRLSGSKSGPRQCPVPSKLPP